jgi:hypothetical protein
VSTLTRFFGVFPDEFDNVVMFTDSAVLTNGAFAYELTVANDIQGLNIELFDASQEWGSRGVLQSLVMMDALGKYPDDPCQIFLGTNSTLSVLGQEYGHRWAAFLTCRDAGGRVSHQLLAATTPIGASSLIPTPRSWRATTSKISAMAASGR